MIWLMSDRADDWGILKLQNCILNIAQYIDEFCDRYGISYCLMGGSALGALRHKGFIPWDDDLDIFMTPDNYEAFREQFNKNGDKENYYLQEWGARNGMVSMAKVRMNNTFLAESTFKDWDIHQGVFVDIFILHTCPDGKVAKWRQYLWNRYLVAKSLSVRHYNRRKGVISVLLFFLRMFPTHFLHGKALKEIYRNRSKETEYLCHFIGRANIITGLYKRMYFKKTKKVPFESIYLRVPEMCHEYLSDRWGNYMKLPSLEEIRYYQHASEWSDNDERYLAGRAYNDEDNLLA